MKTLICVKQIQTAVEQGQKEISVDSNTIITPAAKDMAKDQGIAFVDTVITPVADAATIPQPACNVGKVDKGINKDVIYQIVKQVLAARGMIPMKKEPFLTESDQSGFKIVRGSSVTYEKIDTGTADTNVARREVISKDESGVSAGFITIDGSTFSRELIGYGEIDIVMEGSLTVSINGMTHSANQGDVVFIPKDSKVVWTASEHVKLFYSTFSANGANQA